MGQKLLAGVMACGIEQNELERLGARARRALGGRGFDFETLLFLDTIEGISDLHELARIWDGLVFHRERMGLGTARSAVLQAAGARGADVVLIMDGDGQYGIESLLPLIEKLAEGELDAVYPNRAQRHLPLAGEGELNRLVAEYFQNYVIANAAGKPACRWWDLQPGAFVLKSSAVEATLGQIASTGFSWDLEFSFRLLSSPLRIGQMPVAVRPQTATLFTAADFEAVLGYLFGAFSRERVLSEFDEFIKEDRVRAAFSERETEALRTIVGRL
jgi:glycosyltransferase involved in cell wall biosynthesis